MFPSSFFTLNRKSTQVRKHHLLINFISVQKTFLPLLLGGMKIQTFVLFIFQLIQINFIN